MVVHFNLNPNIWLSPLIIFGTQWYILFNVIAGASAFPADLREAYGIFKIKGWIWWKKIIIPGIFPYLITGIITAAGNAWNTTIVAEAVSWGHKSIYAVGLGSYIAEKTIAGNFSLIALGICVMSFYVVLFDKFLWRPLYRFSEKTFKLE